MNKKQQIRGRSSGHLETPLPVIAEVLQFSIINVHGDMYGIRGTVANTNACVCPEPVWKPVIGWHYLSNAAYLIQPRLFVCVSRRVKDHHTLLDDSHCLKNTPVRQVVLDKWCPPEVGWVLSGSLYIIHIMRITCYICCYYDQCDYDCLY